MPSRSLTAIIFIETCTEMYGIMRNVCKGTSIEIYTLNFKHTFLSIFTHTHMETACITSYFRFHIIREHHIRGIQWLRSPSWLQWGWSGSSRCWGVSTRCWHIKNTICQAIEKCVYYILIFLYIHILTYVCTNEWLIHQSTVDTPINGWCPGLRK